MPVIIEDMRQVIKETRLCFAATVNEDGTPNLSPKASLMVYDDNHLVFANIASPNTLANLKRNPSIEINTIDIFRRRGYRFKGIATLHPPGTPEYDFVSIPFHAEHGDAFPIHDIVKVKVERATPVISPAYTFIDGVTEEALRQSYLTKYGVQALNKTVHS